MKKTTIFLRLKGIRRQINNIRHEHQIWAISAAYMALENMGFKAWHFWLQRLFLNKLKLFYAG